MESKEAVRRMLSEYYLSQVWLIQKLKEKGIITDRSELSSVLRGVRHGPKADSIISVSYSILADYAEREKNSA